MGMQVAVMVVILGKMAEIREEKLEVVAWLSQAKRHNLNDGVPLQLELNKGESILRDNLVFKIEGNLMAMYNP